MTYEFSFNVDDITLLSKSQTYSSNKLDLPFAEHFDGSIRLRLRCCRIKEPSSVPVESEWITTATKWPQHTFIALSTDKRKAAVIPRRASQHPKDLPAELTDMVSKGMNKLVVSVNEPNASSYRHFLAVELIETRSFSTILGEVHARVLDPKTTVENIRRKAGWIRTEQVDDIQMEARAEYMVDLRCPFTATIWETPVLGVDCLHIQCFDLNTWLKTRDRNPSRLHCQTHPHQCNCLGPYTSVVDHWKCPICKGDARPHNLRVDGFLTEVRRKLETEGNLRNTKTLAVYPDSTWKPIKEDHDDDDDDEENETELSGRRQATNGMGTAARNQPCQTSSRNLSVPQGSRKPHYEVIDLLSDED